jgi:acyl-CoA synthetase (NDP forming)
VAGVVIAGLAIGAAIGTALRKLFGEARAVRAEEAAVEGALVLRKARAALEAHTGRPVTQAEARKLFDAYAANLMQLGFTQDANGQWRRQRSTIERILG